MVLAHSRVVWVVAALWPQLGACLPKHSKFQVTKSGVIELVENRQLRLNAKGGGMQEGDPLVLWPCSAQSHEIFDMSGSTIKLRSNPLLCLNAEGGANPGAKIITWPCAHRGSPETHERFNMGADGRIRLIEKRDMCINVKGGLVEPGGQLVLWPCGTDASHKHDIFQFVDGVIQLKADPDYHFNAAGGDITNSVPVVLWKCEASKHEVFEFTYPDHRIRLKHKPEMCLNAEGGLASGARVILWPCSPDVQVNEKFIYDENKQVISPQAIRTLAFNVKNGNTQNGGEIILWTTDEVEIEPTEL